MRGSKDEQFAMRHCHGLRAAILIVWAAAAGVSAQPITQNGAGAPTFAFGPDDIASPQGLPQLGKWMIDPDGTVAHWLGSSYEGKHIREPINIILIDRGATSAEEAVTRLLAAATAAGYPSREGHSSGYRGFIAGEFYDQLPTRHHAFSNRPFELDNNHGRIFGPAPYEGGYLFIGAFSRERIDIFRDPPHQYASFDQARDDFSQRLDAGTGFTIAGFADLGNAIIGDVQITTGDHDGRAVLMLMDK